MCFYIVQQMNSSYYTQLYNLLFGVKWFWSNPSIVPSYFGLLVFIHFAHFFRYYLDFSVFLFSCCCCVIFFCVVHFTETEYCVPDTQFIRLLYSFHISRKLFFFSLSHCLSMIALHSFLLCFYKFTIFVMFHIICS